MIKSIKPWELAIKKIGIANLNEMQRKSIEIYKSQTDIILLSPTGSGKTLAFLLPLLENFNPNIKEVEVIIITPSRELAQQIEMVFKSLGTSYKVNSCYGGHSMRTEKNNFSLPPSILIGTPGRLADHIRTGSFATKFIHTLILDEFDKSLEFGFQQEMSFIINHLPFIKRRILSSATELKEIPEFTGMKSPFKLNFLSEENQDKNLTINIVKSINKDKLDCLFHLLCTLGTGATLIFCNHREAVERISNHLNQAGIINDYFHGGLEQDERERMLIRFKNGSSNILITTDLASRGLDIADIQYIIHYQAPSTESAFVHRNGRTARMNSAGTSFLLLSEDESLPAFIHADYQHFDINYKSELRQSPLWETLYIGGGKKDKINKIDIVGFLCKQGGLDKDELGYIEVKDHCAYVAVKRNTVHTLFQKIKNSKIKNKKLKIEISY